MFHVPQPTSVHFSHYAFRCLLCACLYASHCLSLPMRLCTSLSTLALRIMHLTLYLPYACRYTFHCLLSLCVHLCVSVYFPCACLYAFHSSLALRISLAQCMPLCISLSALCMPPCGSPVYFPCSCIYAFHSALPLCMPLCISLPTFPAHASMHFTL